MAQLSALHLFRNTPEQAATVKVGDGCTILHYTDSDPATVVRISPSGKTIWVREDHSYWRSGSAHDGSAEYEYAPNPGGSEQAFRYTKKGWTGGGARLLVGVRRHYRDPSF